MLDTERFSSMKIYIRNNDWLTVNIGQRDLKNFPLSTLISTQLWVDWVATQEAVKRPVKDALGAMRRRQSREI